MKIEDKELQEKYSTNAELFWALIQEKYPTIKEYLQLGYNTETKEIFIKDIRKK